VEFRDLSLVVVDEQHRFGVGQRTVFREKGTTPDTLVMTATPIPRTLSLTLYGDLEVSVIDELPPGRKPVETRVVDPAERDGAYEEVGLDVANASAIVIEGAERFGLSQLHQLRGRVCRGLHPPKCFLVGDPKTEDSARRLEALAEYQDGFKLSEVDLAIRGEGTLFGSRQSGMPDLKVAKLLRDIDILVEARREAFALVAQDPTLKRPDHRPLRREVRELLGSNVEWLFRE
jgi:RecG-like helicase